MDSIIAMTLLDADNVSFNAINDTYHYTLNIALVIKENGKPVGGSYAFTSHVVVGHRGNIVTAYPGFW